MVARRVWEGMRRGFPDALAGMVMLDHVHVVDEREDEDEARRKLARVLSRATYGRGERLWLPVPQPDVVREAKLRRVVRYVMLNPCRKGLTDDPAEWVWSTYRDVMGAAAEPWVDARRLARRLGEREVGFEERFRRYVTTDGRVGEAARKPYVAALPVEAPTHGLEEIAIAVAASLRCSPEEIRRKGLARQASLELARSQGWSGGQALADACGVTTRAIRKGAAGVDDDVSRAGLVCLGSRRWRRNFEG